MITVVYIAVSFLAGLAVGALVRRPRPTKSVHALDGASSWFQVPVSAKALLVEEKVN